MSLAISVTAFAVEKDTTSQPKNEVVLQRRNGTVKIDLPTNISKVELDKLKRNILKYGNQVLSQEEVDRINAEGAARDGLVYGPWFGGTDKYYAMSLDETVTFFAAVGAVVTPFLDWAEVISVTATDVTSGICSAVGLHYAIPSSVSQGQWVKANMAKKYREVKYSDGTFAYFQTGFFANNLNVAKKSYGSPVTIFSGQLD